MRASAARRVYCTSICKFPLAAHIQAYVFQDLRFSKTAREALAMAVYAHTQKIKAVGAVDREYGYIGKP